MLPDILGEHKYVMKKASRYIGLNWQKISYVKQKVLNIFCKHSRMTNGFLKTTHKRARGQAYEFVNKY